MHAVRLKNQLQRSARDEIKSSLTAEVGRPNGWRVCRTVIDSILPQAGAAVFNGRIWADLNVVERTERTRRFNSEPLEFETNDVWRWWRLQVNAVNTRQVVTVVEWKVWTDDDAANVADPTDVRPAAVDCRYWWWGVDCRNNEAINQLCNAFSHENVYCMLNTVMGKSQTESLAQNPNLLYKRFKPPKSNLKYFASNHFPNHQKKKTMSKVENNSTLIIN